MCTSSLRLCVVVWFMPPVVFAQFQQRFERVCVPALYVLRSIFRTEPLSLIGRNVRKKIDHLFVHCPRATGHSADGESAFQLHGATNKDLTLCTSKTWELLGADAGHEDALSQGPKAELHNNFGKVEGH